MSEPIQPATEGRIVHVRAPGVTHCQPAIVVRNWGGTEPGALNLVVFRDGSNDREGPEIGGGVDALTRWATSVPHESQTRPEAQSWHWPERV